MASLPFSPRRFTNETAVQCAKNSHRYAVVIWIACCLLPVVHRWSAWHSKLARHVTNNFKVVSLWDSFHGASIDAISVGGEACFREGMGPLMAGVERIPQQFPISGAFPLQWLFFASRARLRRWKWEAACDVHYADYLEYVIEKEGGIGAPSLRKQFITQTFKCQVRLTETHPWDLWQTQRHVDHWWHSKWHGS